MATIACKECGHAVSRNAKACPSCGEPPPKRTSVVAWIFVLIFGALVYQCATITDRVAERRERTAAEQAADEARRKAENFTVGARADCQIAIKKFLKDPASATFDDFDTAPVTLGKKDTVIVTMLVRSRNSFGAIVPQRFRCNQTRVGDDTRTTLVTGL